MGASLDSGTCLSGGSATLGGKTLLGFDHGLDTIVHILYEVSLRSTETSLVGDVEDTIISLSVLTVNASNLDVVFVSNRVEGSHVLSEARELDMN